MGERALDIVQPKKRVIDHPVGRFIYRNNRTVELVAQTALHASQELAQRIGGKEAAGRVKKVIRPIRNSVAKSIKETRAFAREEL